MCAHHFTGVSEGFYLFIYFLLLFSPLSNLCIYDSLYKERKDYRVHSKRAMTVADIYKVYQQQTNEKEPRLENWRMERN